MKNLTPIVDHLNRSRAALLAMTEAVPEKLWKKSPRPGAWSAGEVIAHLTMVETSVIDGAAKIVRRAPVPVPYWKRIHLPVRLAGWRGFRAKTPIPLDPALVAEKQLMLDRLTSLRRSTLTFLETNRTRDLHPYRFKHPFFGSLDVYDWLRMIAFHEARHTQQLQEIVSSFQH